MSQKTWVTEGFEAFRRGTFGNGGQNLYVSKKGILQRIFQYDLNRDGYVDLVFANCQNHGESAPSYVYTQDGQRTQLPGQGSVCAMTLDIDGDGWEDIVVTGLYDMAAPNASTDIYFGSPEGYSEKYHIRIPTPFATDCCYGDFNGKGKPILAFVLPKQRCVRLFEQTKNNCLEWKAYTDFPIEQLGKREVGIYAADSHLICAADLDGDGYDDLIHREEHLTRTTVYWGGPEGLDPSRKTVLPELPTGDILQPEEKKTIESAMETKFKTPRLLQKVRWNSRDCFTLSTGKKMIFFSSNQDRQLERVLEFPVPMAKAVAVGDLDGDGYDDIAVACVAKNETDPDIQCSFILWNGPDGLDKRPRTVLNTRSACDVSILENNILFCQCSAGRLYTNDSLLFTYPDFDNPQRFEGEDPRRCALIRNPDGVLRVFLNNHFSRSSIGFDETYIYWGSPEGYSPDNMLAVPSHCAVDAMIADFNDDGWAELLVANNSENSGHLDPGHHMHYFGPNGFEPEKSHNLITNMGWGVVAGDFDRDGYLEIITPGGSEAGPWTQLRMYSAKDRFHTWQVIDLPKGSSARWMTAVDINNDGWLDLLVPNIAGNSLIYWGGPEGFSLEHSMELATHFTAGASAADLTGNGYPDLILGGYTETLPAPHTPHHSFLHIYWNGPEGIKESRKCVLRGDAVDHMLVADFNNDGWPDIFACSYHGGKDRDINSFLYWNREGRFSEMDRDLLYTHSASGCLAADFNEDGYTDLAVANHKVDGDHHGFSTVWWNGPKGFNRERSTDLPTEGPHGMISTELGNIMDRSFSEYYFSEPWQVETDCKVTGAYTEGDIPPKTAVHLLLRVNGGDWVAAEGLQLKQGDSLEYRLELYAYNCLRTPRIQKVVIEMS